MLRIADPRRARRAAHRAAVGRDRDDRSATGRCCASSGPREALALFTQALAGSAAGAVTDYALLARPWHVALDEIPVPVHCWHGTADTLVPLAHTEAMLERLPNARLTTWPGEGHLALITHVAEVLDDIAASLDQPA